MYYLYVTNRFVWKYVQVGWIDLQGQQEESYKDGLYTDDGHILLAVIYHQAFPLQPSPEPLFSYKGGFLFTSVKYHWVTLPQ